MGNKNENNDNFKYILTGMCLGVTVGIVIDKLAAGIALGVLIGYLVYEYKEKKK